MKQSEKMIVFTLAALFHAARIAGSTARDGTDTRPDEGESIFAAQQFLTKAVAADIVPDVPD